MIDIEKIKNKLKPEDSEKIDLAMSKLRTLTPESRNQILEAMKLMIECDELREEKYKLNHHIHDKTDIDEEKLNKLLTCKYDELKTLAKVNINIDSREKAIMALAKVLNVGTYLEGAEAIDVLIKLNIIFMKLHPEMYFNIDKVKEN